MTIQNRADIAAQLAAALAPTWSSVPIQSDTNLSFTPPNAAPWVRLTVQDGDESLVAIGGATGALRTPVLAFVDTFAPAGTGDGEAVAITEAIMAGFRRWSLNGLRWVKFRSGIEGRGQGADVALYRKQLIIVFSLAHRG